MRAALLLVASLFLPDRASDATCARLELPPPVFSFRHHEDSLYRRVIETIRKENGATPGAEAVVATFVACLARAKALEDRPPELQWLDRLIIEGNRIELDGRRIDLAARRDRSLAETAEAVLRRLVRRGSDEMVLRLAWHAWVEALIEATGNRHNRYIYASDLDHEAGVSRGRVFTVGFEVHRDGEDLVVARILDEDLRQRGMVEGARILLLDDHAVAEHSYRELVRYWYSLEPFTYSARLSAGGKVLDVAASSVPRRLRTVDFVRRDDVGYVRIDRFADETVLELRRALRQLEGTIAIVLDLRGNGGGRLSIDLIDMFFKSGEKLVTYRGVGDASEPTDITGSIEYYGQKLIVLVDRDSASMSELLAAAIRQHRRGLLVGEATSGKGVSQTVFPIADEGELHLVRAEYFYPGTRITWHEKGIEPDVQVDVTDEQRQQLLELRSAPIVDLLAQASMDPVLSAALRLLEESP